MHETNELLRMRDVKRITSVTDRSIRNWVAAGKFPQPRKINGRCVWPAKEVNDWLEKQIEAA